METEIAGRARAMFIGKGGAAISKLERETAARIALRDGKVHQRATQI